MRSSKKPSKAELKKRILTRGVDRVVERGHLDRALNSSRRLRVKLGIDPTAPDLHLGNAVVLRKLKEFQELGHKIVFVIGDFTGQVGDPSGQSKEREVLTEEEIKSNMKRYLTQAGKVIDIKKTEIKYNSEWLGKSVRELLELARAGTIQQVLQRADFRERIDKGGKVTLLEAFYALFQGYDSVKLKADVELGGNDQLLNLLMGRQVQRYFNMPAQDILTVPLLEGTDGVRKMSKSYKNYIGLDDPPNQMFGKIMSINDRLIAKYFLLCTDVPENEIAKIERDIKQKKLNPRDAKLRLAGEIVSIYHGEKEAKRAETEFIYVFRKKELPKKILSVTFSKKKAKLTDVLVDLGLATSRNEARRLITQGGVKVNLETEKDPYRVVRLTKNGIVIQVGKRRFLKVKTK